MYHEFMAVAKVCYHMRIPVANEKNMVAFAIKIPQISSPGTLAKVEGMDHEEGQQDRVKERLRSNEMWREPEDHGVWRKRASRVAPLTD